MIISVGSTILGIGRSSSFTFNVPLKTTAFIVVFDILLFGLFGIVNSEFPQRRSYSFNRSSGVRSFNGEVSLSKNPKVVRRCCISEEAEEVRGTAMPRRGHGELDRLQAKAALCEPTSNLLR
jgi:hypothetical protein